MGGVSANDVVTSFEKAKKSDRYKSSLYEISSAVSTDTYTVVFDVNSENSVGLGLSDVAFFKQLQSKLEKIEDEHDKYMGTLIQLSNHSPYAATDWHPEMYDKLFEKFLLERGLINDKS